MTTEIKFDSRNYRKHNTKNKRLIKKSLEECGAGRSILIDGDDEIIAGNGVYEQAQKLKMPVRIIETDGSEIVAIKRTDLKTTDEKRKQLAVMDNSTSDSSEFDFELMAQDFNVEALEDMGVDLPDNILPEEPEVVEDEIPEKCETRCKPGDIWQLGKHRLMCCDSTIKENIEKLMDGKKADMVYEDPPYGMYLDTDYRDMKGFLGKSNKFEKVIGDNDDFKPELITTTLSFFDYCKEIFLWGADYYAETITNRKDGSWIVWDKSIDESGDKMFGSNFELCWSKNRHKRELARVKWKGLFGMEKDDTKHRVHPTQKPSLLAQWFLDRYSKENQRVVDLFGGSGSTLIACEQLGRICYMMEIDPKYCDVILQRFENLTGIKPVLLERKE